MPATKKYDSETQARAVRMYTGVFPEKWNGLKLRVRECL